MSPEDVPNPIDFHNEAEARAWIEQTIQKRPYRSTFFNEFVNEVSRLERHQLKVLELGSGPGMLAEQILHRNVTVHFVANEIALYKGYAPETKAG